MGYKSIRQASCSHPLSCWDTENSAIANPYAIMASPKLHGLCGYDALYILDPCVSVGIGLKPHHTPHIRLPCVLGAVCHDQVLH